MAYTEFYKEQKFQDYLVYEREVNLQENTARSYLSFIRSAYNNFFENNPRTKGYVAELQSNLYAGRLQDACRLLSKMIDILFECKSEHDETFMKYKDMHNSGSALRAYRAYLSYIMDNKEREHLAFETQIVDNDESESDEEAFFGAGIQEELGSKKEGVVFFDRSELESRLKFRLSSQDRSGYFSIRLISKLFSDRGVQDGELERSVRVNYPKFQSFPHFVEQWLEECAQGINLYVDEGNTNLFIRDVAAMEIDITNNEVFVLMDSGRRHRLYSITSDGEIVSMVESMRNLKLKDITIEHVPTFKSFYEEHRQELSGLSALEELMSKTLAAIGIPNNPWKDAVKYLRKQIRFEDIEEYAEQIVLDMLYIKESIRLELKGSKFNTNPKKNK